MRGEGLKEAFLYSVPAIVFGAVLFWWFRDKGHAEPSRDE
jgi:hypothetical protein